MLVAVIYCVVGLFLILCSLLPAFWVYMTITNLIESRHWASVEGTIDRSHIVSNRDGIGGLPGYHYSIGFSYKIKDKEYYSDNVRWGWFRYFIKSRAQKIIDKYPVGREVTVYYDANYPDVAVLEPGWSLECLYPLCVFGFVFGLGLSLILVAIFRLI